MKSFVVIPYGRIKKRIKAIANTVREDRVGVYAAETAFFIVLSAVPFLMLIFNVAGSLVNENVGDYLTLFITGLPGVIGEYMESQFLTLAKRPVGVPVSAGAALWSASKGVRAVRRGVRSVYGESSGTFISEALTGLVFTVVFIVLIIAVLVFFVFGDALLAFFGAFVPSLYRIFDLTLTMSPVIFTVLLALFFAGILRAFTPDSAGIDKFSEQLPGAVIASVGWILYSYLFSLFIDRFSSVPSLYGSLGAIMILMIWIYMIMYIFLIGAELNKYLFSKSQKMLINY